MNVTKQDDSGKDKVFNTRFEQVRKVLDSEKDNLEKKIDPLKQQLDGIKPISTGPVDSEKMEKYENDLLAVFNIKRNSNGGIDAILGGVTDKVLNINHKVYSNRAESIKKFYTTAESNVKQLNSILDSNKDSFDNNAMKNINATIKAYTDYSKMIFSSSTLFLRSSKKIDTIYTNITFRI